MFSDPRFWIGVVVGIAAYVAWQKYQAQKAA